MFLMVIKYPNEKYPREFECKDMWDLECTYNIWFDSDDCEVEFYDATHQIFPEWAQ